MVVRVAEVTRQSAPSTIDGIGYIEALPSTEARLSAPYTGRITRLAISEGDDVSQGQVVAELYNADLVGTVSAAQGVLEEMRASEHRTAKDAERQGAEERVRIAQAQASLDAVQADLDKLLSGARSQEIEQARSALAREEAKLAELRAGTRVEDVAAARRELDAQQAALAELRNGSRPEEIEEAEAALRVEQAELERRQAGPRRQEVAEAEATLRSAETAFSTAQAASQRADRLYGKGIFSQAEAEGAQADLASARAARDTAAQQLSALREGTRPEEIRAQEARVAEARARYEMVRRGPRQERIDEAEAKVEAAKEAVRKAEAGPRPEEVEQQVAEVRRAGAELDLLTSPPRPEDVTAARSAVARALAELDRARAGRLETEAAHADVRAAAGRSQEARGHLAEATAFLANSVIRAPVSGRVANVAARVGESVTEGSPIAEITSLTALQVRLRIPVDSLETVRTGLDARVSVGGVPDRTFSGAVSVVSPSVMAETGTAEVLIYLDSPDGVLREGMIAQVSIEVPEVQTVAVPDEAIISEEAQTLVYVVEDGVAEKTPVIVGESIDGETRVLEGLRPGQRVVIEGGYGLPDEAAVTVEP